MASNRDLLNSSGSEILHDSSSRSTVFHRPCGSSPSLGHSAQAVASLSQQLDQLQTDKSSPTGSDMVMMIQLRLHCFLRQNSSRFKYIAYGVLLCGYTAYFGYAMYYSIFDNIGLLVLTVLFTMYWFYRLLRLTLSGWILDLQSKVKNPCLRLWKYGRWITYGGLYLSLIIFLAVDARHDPKRLVPVAGLLVFVVTSFLFSKNCAKVPWRVVLSGLLLQFGLGLVILRWSHGYSAFQWMGDQVTHFLSYTDHGIIFVFGEDHVHHEPIFQILSIIIFFGAMVSVLYYWGILQVLIRVFGSVINFVMDVGPVEAFIAAANIFLGPNTSVLTIACFLSDMTLSELHCVMTAGFATVTGSMLGVYTSFGVPASHLISASVMSAPSALVIAKILYPENRRSKLNNLETIEFQKPKEQNVIEAFSAGASDSVKIITHILVNLIGFVAFLTFINATLAWFGARVGLEQLSFEMICSYVFAPVAYLMGVEWTDCVTVAKLIGTKLFLTDIYAYMELGTLIRNRQQNLLPAISARSEVIATYALCGFASFGDLGICLGAIGAIAPTRKSDLAQVGLRAMVAGNLACFITACVAGLLLTPG